MDKELYKVHKGGWRKSCTTTPNEWKFGWSNLVMSNFDPIQSLLGKTMCSILFTTLKCLNFPMNPFASFAAPVVSSKKRRNSLNFCRHIRVFQHLSPSTCCHSFKAGAIPILVDHLNHDMARVRIEATRALWSLAENNLETWERKGWAWNIARFRTVFMFFLLGEVVVQICGVRSCLFFCKN